MDLEDPLLDLPRAEIDAAGDLETQTELCSKTMTMDLEDPMLNSLYYKTQTLTGNEAEGTAEINSTATRRSIHLEIDDSSIAGPSTSSTTGESALQGNADDSIFVGGLDLPFAVILNAKDRMRFIDEGSFGRVYGYPIDNPTIAVKISKPLRENDDGKEMLEAEQLLKELKIHQKLAHEHIVRYLGSVKLNDRLCVILEYVDGGNLHKYLQEINKDLPRESKSALGDSVIKDYMRQILLGLRYLHNKQIVHRDLKSLNVLRTANNILKIADFGLSKELEQNKGGMTSYMTVIGDNIISLWLPPERINADKFTRADRQHRGFDIWSTGILFLEITCVVPPHFRCGHDIYKAMVLLHNYVPEIPEFVDRNSRHLIEQCLKYKTHERPTCTELLQSLETGRVETPNPTASRSTATPSKRLTSTARPDVMLVVGGMNNKYNALDTVECYEPTNNTWRSWAPLHTARSNVAVASVVGYVYAVGGYNSSTRTLNTAECYDPETNTWTLLPRMSFRKHGPAVAVLEGVMYVLGGLSGGLQDLQRQPVECYTPASRTWTRVTPMSEYRYYLGAATLHGQIYAVGGRYASSNLNTLNTVERYDTTTAQWSGVANMSTSRGEVAVTTLHNKLYAAGGSGRVTTLNSVETYDPERDTWHTIRSMNTERRGAALTSLSNCLYVVGGLDGSRIPLKTVERYDPRTGQWDFVQPMKTARYYHGVAVTNRIL